jgi:hypothetical protein
MNRMMDAYLGDDGILALADDDLKPLEWVSTMNDGDADDDNDCDDLGEVYRWWCNHSIILYWYINTFVTWAIKIFRV